MRRTKFAWVLVIAVFALALPAQAVVVPISTVVLNGGGTANWDPNTDLSNYCIENQKHRGYAPVEDGSTDLNDGFDNGMLVEVNGTPFDIASGNGNEVGEQLTAGPVKLKGLSVKRIDRVLPDTPTLRSLAMLKNSSTKALTRTINLNSNMGSDSSTIVVATSSGDAVYDKSDRWLVTGGDSGDPPVTHILYGKGAASVVSKILCEPTVATPEDGYLDELSVDLKVRVPAKSTRYVMFFAQMHLTSDHGAGHVASIADAQAFDAKTLNAGLLDGLSNKVKNNILNWDL